jgi:hypothetical protein
MKRPSAYEQWLYKVSDGDFEMIKHIITQSLIEGNQATFDLCEEAGGVDIDDQSLNQATKYLINKVENYETGNNRLGTRI